MKTFQVCSGTGSGTGCKPASTSALAFSSCLSLCREYFNLWKTISLEVIIQFENFSLAYASCLFQQPRYQTMSLLLPATSFSACCPSSAPAPVYGCFLANS